MHRIRSYRSLLALRFNFRNAFNDVLCLVDPEMTVPKKFIGLTSNVEVLSCNGYSHRDLFSYQLKAGKYFLAVTSASTLLKAKKIESETRNAK